MKHLRRLVKKYSLNKKTIRALGVLVVLVFAMSVAHFSTDPHSYTYVEVGFTELSPNGESAGRIVPASCNATDPPTNNAGNYGQVCRSATNSCGMSNTSTYDTCGNCPAVAPSDAACTAPDLTAGGISPTSAVAGTSVNLSATVSNVGNGSAVASQTLFQKANDASGTGATSLGSAATADIPASASVTATYSYTFPAGDAGTTKYIRACADTTNTVTESNEGNNCGAWTAVAVTATTQADLTAGAISPTTATAGAAVNFSSLISNPGTLGAGATQTRFQRANDSIGTGAMTLGSSPTASLSPNGTVTSSFSYAFPAGDAGTTKFMRACADTNNAVVESNEGNNCGAWTAIAVTAGGSGSPSVTLTATPTSITVGQSSSLTWTSANVTSCTGTNFSTSGAINNSTGVSVSPTAAFTDYTITCTGPNGTVTDTETVIVNAAAAPDLVAGGISPTNAVAGSATTFTSVIFNFNIGDAAAGSSHTLFQKATDASGTGATNLGSSATAAVPAWGSVLASYTYTFPAGDAGTTKYMRACADTNGEVSEHTEGNNCGSWTAIAIGTTPVPSVNLTGSPSSIYPGQSSKLLWSSANVTSCAGTNFSTSNATSNLTGVSVSPTITTTYSITCTGPYGTATDSEIVTVYGGPDLMANSITPTSAVAGVATTFSTYITNVGNGNAGASQTLFQKANDAGGTGATNLGSASTAAISVSSRIATVSFNTTFPLADAGTTKYMRACADGGGTVTELNEANNCGPWTAITINDNNVPSVTLTATPSSIATGHISTLTWSSANVTSCAGTNFSTSDDTSNSTGVEVGPIVTTTYTIDCTGPYGTATDSKTVTVSDVDLTAGPTSPATAVAGVATDFSSIVMNVGSANVTATTRTLFQKATDANGANAINMGGVDIAPLYSGGYAYALKNYTFPAGDAGTTKYMRACADTNNVTVESNEGNNCGPWKAVAISATAAPSVTLTAIPSSIATGQSSSLTWTSANVTSCTGTGFTTSNATNNSIGVAVSPVVTTTYTIDCTGPNGTATDSETVTVGAAATPDLTASKIKPTSAVAGTARTFSATISNIGVGNGGSSQTLFQKATDASGTGATTLGSSATASILSGGSVKSSYSYTFPAGDAGTTKYMRACADTTNLVTESNEGNNCGAWTAITVMTTAQADLTAGDVSPTSAVAGAAVNLSSLVDNVGTASASASETLFQKANDASGGGATNLGNTSAASVSPDASVTSIYGYSFPLADAGTTKYIRACADTTNIVNEFNEGNNCGAWTAVAVTATAQADLTADSISPTSAAAGAATTFNALITNMGSANAGASQTLFQKANDASGTGAANLGSASTAAISASGSATASFSYTFPAGDAGTSKYMRACADGGATVPESNEANNCGPWTEIVVINSCVANAGASCSSPANSCGQTNTGTVQCDGTCSAATPATPSGSSPTVSVAKQSDPSAPITQADPGDTLVITWACPGSSTTSSNNFNLSHAVSGSGTDTITASRTYEVSCNNVCGNTVVPITVTAPMLSLTATPSRVQPNQVSTLKWYALSVNSCTLTGPGVSVSATAVSGNIGSAGTPRQNSTGPIAGQSTYTLSCQTPIGLLTTSVNVSIVPVIIEI